MKDDRAWFLEQRRLNSIALGSDEAVFASSVEAFVKVNKYKYAYLWTWLGVPIIQLPADVMATQEVIWHCRPDIVIETGVARGGSVLFIASLLELIGNGEVVGVDIEISAHNRESIESHPMGRRVKLVEGPSTAAETVSKVAKLIPEGAKVMVLLDSDHSYAHVLDELRTYGPLVSPDQYLVVADTLLGRLNADDTPKSPTNEAWTPGNEPLSALRAYQGETDLFESDDAINGKLVFSSSPGGYLRRKPNVVDGIA